MFVKHWEAVIIAQTRAPCLSFERLWFWLLGLPWPLWLFQWYTLYGCSVSPYMSLFLFVCLFFLSISAHTHISPHLSNKIFNISEGFHSGVLYVIFIFLSFSIAGKIEYSFVKQKSDIYLTSWSKNKFQMEKKGKYKSDMICLYTYVTFAFMCVIFILGGIYFLFCDWSFPVHYKSNNVCIGPYGRLLLVLIISWLNQLFLP